MATTPTRLCPTCEKKLCPKCSRSYRTSSQTSLDGQSNDSDQCPHHGDRRSAGRAPGSAPMDDEQPRRRTRTEYTLETGSYSCSSNMDRSDKLKKGKPRMYNIFPNVIMVLRHTDRLDDFFPNWLQKSDKGGYRAYDLNMPLHLPLRRPLKDYESDPPFTNTGDILARMIGRGMYSTSYVPDIIYTSPDLCSIQTAYAVRSICKCNSPIRVEPGLFERTSQHPDGMPKFATKEQRQQFHIDESYQPYVTVDQLKKNESSTDYNKRVRNTLVRFLKLHEPSPSKKDQLILVVGHASTVDLAAGHLAKKNRQSSDADMSRNTEKIPYGSLLVLERIEGRRGWTPNLYAIPPVTYKNVNTQFDVGFVLRDAGKVQQ
ncbi:hypothetical protein Q1695_002435 [Nippostrongylus brasiliensis]|nr:hypothetical protein Q1695_002435 [Nippostrongylus brasiliensis]